MRTYTRLIATLLIAILLLLSLAGCAEEKPEENPLYSEIVGTMGEYDILYEELRFVTLTYRQILDATYGDDNAENGTIWDDPVTAEKYREELKSKVLAMMAKEYRVLAACSAYGIGRDVLEGSEIQGLVDRQYKTAMDTFESEEAFLKDMSDKFMTERLYRLYLARDFMKYKLRDAVLKDTDSDIIKDQESFHKWLINGNCVYVQHVFLRNDKNEDKETNRLLAQEISDALQSGDEVIDSYVGSRLNDDVTNIAPYYLIPYLYDEALTDAGLRLYSDGDATDVIETEEGFYVLQRVEEPKGTLESKLADLFDTYLWTKIGATSSDTESTVTLNEFGKSVDLVTMN